VNHVARLDFAGCGRAHFSLLIAIRRRSALRRPFGSTKPSRSSSSRERTELHQASARASSGRTPTHDVSLSDLDPHQRPEPPQEPRPAVCPTPAKIAGTPHRPVDRHAQLLHRGGTAHVTQCLPDVVERLAPCAAVPLANSPSNAENTRIPGRRGVTRAAPRGGEHRAARPRRRRGSKTQSRGGRPRSDPPGRPRNVRLDQPDAAWRAHTDGNWAPIRGNCSGSVGAGWVGDESHEGRYRGQRDKGVGRRRPLLRGRGGECAVVNWTQRG